VRILSSGFEIDPIGEAAPHIAQAQSTIFDFRFRAVPADANPCPL
jgi:hypothetical protein